MCVIIIFALNLLHFAVKNARKFEKIMEIFWKKIAQNSKIGGKGHESVV